MIPRVQTDLFLGILAALAIAVLISLDDNQARLEAWQTAQTGQAIQRGAALYRENCRSCHGDRGEGLGDLGPALNEEHFFLGRMDEVYWTGTLEEYVENVIATGRVVPTRDFYTGDGQVAMQAWAQAYGGPLRPDEIADLTAYVLNWRPTALGEATLVPLVITATPRPVGDAELGRAVFLDGGCAECHAVAGVTSSQGSGPDLTHVAKLAAERVPALSAEGYLRESFLIPEAYRVDGYPEASGCGGVLSHEQLDHLIAFLLSLE